MDDQQRYRLTRRGFLAGTIAAAVAAACSDGNDDSASNTGAPGTEPSGTTAPTTQAPTTTQPSPVPSDPFLLGVASGDPLPDSVILWTMLAPVGVALTDDIDVQWDVALDDSFAEVAATGTATALAALGHSVHADASGLTPDTRYHFRFRVGEYTSPVGRTRTFAAPGTTPERFTFAFSSCQNWEQGYYAAYRDLSEQADLDAFVFLGDYIYEYATGGYSDPRGRSTGQDFECVSLDQYRQRYALYRSDPLLQQAHAHAPWIITWDDHEVDNDYAGAISQDDDDTATFLERRAAAYQAWYEFMPVRLDAPTGPDYEIYRTFTHGDLLAFWVLDTRQYRADQQRNPAFVESIGDAVQVRDEVLAASIEQSLLGDDQRAWLLAGVKESPVIWDVLAQQVFMFGGNAVQGGDPPIVVVDTWDGYAAERRAVLDALGADADNLVVLTGDFHAAAVADLRADPFDYTLPVVGTELMATSIASSFFDDDEAVESLVSTALQTNQQIKWFDSRRGYTLCEVTSDQWTATYRAVADQFDEASSVDVASTWQIAAGTPGAVEQ